MSHYITSMKTDTRFKASDSDKILTRIKGIASGYPSNYGWRQDLLDAGTLSEAARIMGIQLYYSNDCIIPLFNDTYFSMLFKDIASHIAPYMENGYIEGIDDSYGKFRITFKGGKHTFKYMED